MLDTISILLNLLRFHLWPKICSILKNVTYALEKKVYPSAFGWNVLKVSEVAQLCLTLCDPMDCSLPGSSIHGTFQARILERIAIFFSRVFSWPRDQTWVSCIAGRLFTIWATRKGLKRGGGLNDLSPEVPSHSGRILFLHFTYELYWEMDSGFFYSGEDIMVFFLSSLSCKAYVRSQ